jgi:hypothetical protein
MIRHAADEIIGMANVKMTIGILENVDPKHPQWLQR